MKGFEVTVPVKTLFDWGKLMRLLVPRAVQLRQEETERLRLDVMEGRELAAQPRPTKSVAGMPYTLDELEKRIEDNQRFSIYEGFHLLASAQVDIKGDYAVWVSCSYDDPTHTTQATFLAALQLLVDGFKEFAPEGWVKKDGFGYEGEQILDHKFDLRRRLEGKAWDGKTPQPFETVGWDTEIFRCGDISELVNLVRDTNSIIGDMAITYSNPAGSPVAVLYCSARGDVTLRDRSATNPDKIPPSRSVDGATFSLGLGQAVAGRWPGFLGMFEELVRMRVPVHYK